MMNRIELEGCAVDVIPVVRGLVSEADRVERMVTESTRAVAVSLSREEIEGIRSSTGPMGYDPSPTEEIYARLLARFGEVQLPPPCHVAAVRAADNAGLPLVPLDMNEDLFSERYTELVRVRDLVSESLRARRAKHRTFIADSLVDFVMEWDDWINASAGFRRLEEERLVHMAQVLHNSARHHSSMLAFVDLELHQRLLGLL